ncbi:potassium channel family protein [Pelagicoccus sp. SDUM812005]|nr:potassium channel family protein [Pelagicoccus sp. SDUM812005]
METLAYLVGISLVALALFDVYRTVLANGTGRGPIESKLSHWTWLSLRSLGRELGKQSATATMCGPLIVALLLAAWSATLMLGFAFVYWPQLGVGIQSSSHASLESFAFAFYYSGYTLTTLGLGDLYPASSLLRTLTVAQSWLGFTMLTLSISYVLSVYQAIRQQEGTALKPHALSKGTGKARQAFQCLRDSSDPASVFREMHADFVTMHTSHHLYPVIHYFHREREKYSTTRIFYLALEVTSLKLAQTETSGRAEAEQCWVTLEDSVREFAMMITGEQSSGAPQSEPSRENITPEEFSDARDFDLETYLEKRGRWEPQLREICRYLDEEWPEE